MQRAQAEAVLVQFRQQPESWTRVDRILEESGSMHAKFIALQVRSGVVRGRRRTARRAVPQAPAGVPQLASLTAHLALPLAV